jgi:uridine phosphorylase
LQPDTPIGTFILSEKSIGFDGLLNFYAGRDQVCDLSLEAAFKQHVNWPSAMGNPYVAPADTELTARICGTMGDIVRGITIACGGFFGPQGRRLRIPLADPLLNEKIMTFSHDGLRITNFEMESSALSGLSLLLGHKATTICMVVANRLAKEANANYKNSIDILITLVLERI